jgi:hypothetical protein
MFAAADKKPGIDKANKEANINDDTGEDGLFPDLSHLV